MLKPDGVLLSSSRNPRSIFVRPPGTGSVSGREEAVGRPESFRGKAALLVLNLHGRRTRASQSRVGIARRLLARVASRALWRGEGYLLDSAHDRLMTQRWVPAKVVAELQEQQFRLLKVLGDDYLQMSQEYVTDWYYYVFSRSNSVADGGTYA